MKRIGFVSTNECVPWGGSEELWSRTAKHLADQDVEVYASVKKWNPDPAGIAFLEQSACRIDRRVVGRNDPTTFLGKLKRCVRRAAKPDASWLVRQTAIAESWLDRVSPDLVVLSCGQNYEGAHWMETCIRRSVPYVILVQLAKEIDWPNDDGIRRWSDLYGKAERCFFVSRRNLDLTRKQLAMPLDTAEVVRNPFKVPYDIHLPWPQTTDDSVRMAIVGRLECYHKGHDLLFDVLRRDVWQKRTVSLSVFGVGPHEHMLRRLADMWKIGNVTFAGYKDDITEIWRDHHALILPSRVEGLPLAVVEAMLCGRICIVTDVGGNSEVIENDKTGFIADAPTAELLHDAMERAWQRRNNWQEIGARAYRSIREVYSHAPEKDFAEALCQLS